MVNYEKLMRKCLQLAKKAEGLTSPNPLVGAIIVDDKGNIISTGYHHKCGEPHAEVEAIKNAKGSVKGKTLVVNLEPCSHYGKTPPCADLLIEKGIKKVVAGTVDPNTKVAGNGIKKLKKSGIEVVAGVLEEECKKLNEVFFKNHIQKKLFVASKVAQTLDGKIALENGQSKWITSEKSRKYVQKIRFMYDGILTSSKTVIADNPSLTLRTRKKKNFARVILDKNLECPENSKVFNDDGEKVFLFCSKNAKKQNKIYSKNVEIIQTPLLKNHLDLNFICEKLFEKGLNSILIESGGELNFAFLKQNLIDRLFLFSAPKIFGDKNAKNSFYGNSLSKIANCTNLKINNIKFINPDLLTELTVI